jgi:hypothetical protein
MYRDTVIILIFHTHSLSDVTANDDLYEMLYLQCSATLKE